MRSCLTDMAEFQGKMTLLRPLEREHCRLLWADDAGRVLDLLAAGEVETAVDLYFSRVGDRWDAEYLHRQVVRPE
jgi:hypothetical protein